MRTGHRPAADTRILGASAQPARPLEALGGGWGERRHMVPAQRVQPVRPGASRLAGKRGAPQPSSTSCSSSSSWSLPLSGAALPALLSPRFTLPLSFFLSFRFLFSNRVLGCSLGGAQAAQQLANSGWDKSRCCLQLLVPGKLCSVLGELGAARVGGSHPRDSALPGDAGRYRGPNRSELEAATLSRETPVPSSPQPRWFPSLSGPLTPALTAEPPGKTPLRTAMGEGGMGKQARWGRGDPGPE